MDFWYWMLGYELVAIFLIELVAYDIRWHRLHPEANDRIALQHEEQDRLEGR